MQRGLPQAAFFTHSACAEVRLQSARAGNHVRLPCRAKSSLRGALKALYKKDEAATAMVRDEFVLTATERFHRFLELSLPSGCGQTGDSALHPKGVRMDGGLCCAA